MIRPVTCVVNTAPSLDFARTPQSQSTVSTTSLGLKNSGNGLGMVQGGEDMERNGYVMIPAGSGSERTAWPSLTSDLNVLDYPMSFTRMDMSGNGQNWWDVGEGGSPLVGQGGNGGGNGLGEGKNTELDFFSF